MDPRGTHPVRPLVLGLVLVAAALVYVYILGLVLG